MIETTENLALIEKANKPKRGPGRPEGTKSPPLSDQSLKTKKPDPKDEFGETRADRITRLNNLGLMADFHAYKRKLQSEGTMTPREAFIQASRFYSPEKPQFKNPLMSPSFTESLTKPKSWRGNAPVTEQMIINALAFELHDKYSTGNESVVWVANHVQVRWNDIYDLKDGIPGGACIALLVRAKSMNGSDFFKSEFAKAVISKAGEDKDRFQDDGRTNLELTAKIRRIREEAMVDASN